MASPFPPKFPGRIPGPEAAPHCESHLIERQSLFTIRKAENPLTAGSCAFIEPAVKAFCLDRELLTSTGIIHHPSLDEKARHEFARCGTPDFRQFRMGPAISGF